MKTKFFAIFFSFLVLSSLFYVQIIRADELSDLEKQLSDLKHALSLSVAATTPLEKNLDKLKNNLDQIKNKTVKIEQDVRTKEQDILEGEKLLGFAHDLLSQKVRQIYKSSSIFGSYKLFLLFGQNLSESLRQYGYQKKIIESDRDTIVKVVTYIKDLEVKKKMLEEEKLRLSKIKEEIDVQAAFLEKEISGAKKYQTALSRQIANLSARQQELLAQKFASLNLPTSLGGGPLYCTDDRKLDPGFRPAFAFFTYGIPHRVGMNQYGAYGRAKSGQNYQDILKAYFNDISFEKRSNIKIKVQAFGEKNLEEYMLGIYEMPDSWPLDALKAQAVAARSYVLAYTGNGVSEICTTQACQVYKGGNKGGNWERAVKETEGEVMVSGGEAIKAWYASTFGGYTFTSGDVWGSNRSYTKRMRDTSGDISSFSDLAEKSFDRESPCFYAAQGFRSDYAKSAWLKSEEVSDIVNVLLLGKSDAETQKHLSQTDKPNPDNVETWDSGRVKSELKGRGITPYNNISDISVDWDKGTGKVNTVSISGDAGTNSFDGNEFKNFFNLRAPANIQIVGPLYNMERK